MVRERSQSGSRVHPYKLSADELLAIGRTIRACAEIEHITLLYLSDLADIGIGQLRLLLGRASRHRVMELARSFAYAAGGEKKDTFAECFEQDAYTSLIDFRNTVAHGVLLGKTDDGLIAFEVDQQMEHTAQTLSVMVNAFEPSAFAVFADMANHVIPQLEARLKLDVVRERLRRNELTPGVRAKKVKPPAR